MCAICGEAPALVTAAESAPGRVAAPDRRPGNHRRLGNGLPLRQHRAAIRAQLLPAARSAVHQPGDFGAPRAAHRRAGDAAEGVRRTAFLVHCEEDPSARSL